MDSHQRGERSAESTLKMGFGSDFCSFMAITTTLDPSGEENLYASTERTWNPVSIVPLQPILMHPASPAINYGISVFEGMKARYSHARGEYIIFRPDENYKRIINSCNAIALAAPDEMTFLSALKGLLEKCDPVPEDGYLYLRPVVTCNDGDQLGSCPPRGAVFYVIASYVSQPYFSGTLKLDALTDRVRAWPGGTGDKKFAGNYGAVGGALRQSIMNGYHQVLWLFPDANQDDYLVTEAGVSNIFFFVIENDGLVAYTPSLEGGLILPGITRLSIIELLKTMGIVCHESSIYMKRDVMAWNSQGKLAASFATGTAACVTSISCVRFEDHIINIPQHNAVKELSDRMDQIQKNLDDAPCSWTVYASDIKVD